MSTTTENTIETTVIESLKSFGAKEDAISRDATWESIDVDSLDLAELAQIVEDEHGVKMEGDDMKQIKTVGDAIDFITEKKGS
ncbi:MAG: acyl carrier protein [Solirubrobacteraceae bacterium]|jgi:acyl carrier protein|nr:acyl carrier protein [Solirubrobacteraceae bacterium]